MIDDDAKSCSLEIEHRLGVPSLEELLEIKGAIGSCRLVTAASYSRHASIYTLTFIDDYFVASQVLRSTTESAIEQSPLLYERRESKVSFGRARLPELFSSWKAIRDTVVQAPSHSSVVFTAEGINGVAGGIRFIHRLIDRDLDHAAMWDNPRTRYHSKQTKIVVAYQKLFDDLNLFRERRLNKAQRRRKARLNAERRKAKAWKKRKR